MQMNIYEDPFVEGISVEKISNIEDSTVVIRISCKDCTSKRPGCQKVCPQYRCVENAEGKRTAYELLNKGRRAYKHKDVYISFGGFLGMAAEAQEEKEEKQ